MGRNYYKDKPYSSRVAEVIAAHYDELKQRLCPIVYGNHAGRSTEDIFSDTAIYVIQDEAASNLDTDTEILAHFERRHQMITFQVAKDNNRKDIALKEGWTVDHKEDEK